MRKSQSQKCFTVKVIRTQPERDMMDHFRLVRPRYPYSCLFSCPLMDGYLFSIAHQLLCACTASQSAFVKHVTFEAVSDFTFYYKSSIQKCVQSKEEECYLVNAIGNKLRRQLLLHSLGYHRPVIS